MHSQNYFLKPRYFFPFFSDVKNIFFLPQELFYWRKNFFLGTRTFLKKKKRNIVVINKNATRKKNCHHIKKIFLCIRNHFCGNVHGLELKITFISTKGATHFPQRTFL